MIIDRNVLEWRLDPTCTHHIPQVSAADVRVIVVCNEGYSSSLAAATLRELGLSRATYRIGGFQGWSSSADESTAITSSGRRGPHLGVAATWWTAMPSPAVVSALGHQQRPASLAQQGRAHWRRETPRPFCPAEVPDADVAACQAKRDSADVCRCQTSVRRWIVTGRHPHWAYASWRNLDRLGSTFLGCREVWSAISLSMPLSGHPSTTRLADDLLSDPPRGSGDSACGAGGGAYVGSVHAEQMAEESPLVDLDMSALAAVRLLAERRLPALVVTKADGSPHSILPASQVVRFLVPGDAAGGSVAGSGDERVDGRPCVRSAGQQAGPGPVADGAPGAAAVNSDDTIIEVAAIMARLRCPLAAVMKGNRLIGVISASRLLELALQPT